MNRRKSNPTSPKAKQTMIPELPSHFAEQVLDCETDLDLDCKIETVRKLIELYSSAIEHYESITDPKYLHYQDRLNNLLSRKDVITLLNHGEKAVGVKLKPNEMLKKMQEQIAVRQRYRAHQVTLFMTKNLPESKEAEMILRKHRSDNNLVKDKLIENIRNQESPNLEDRAEARRRRSETPNTSFCRTFSLNLVKKMNGMDRYQEEVEKVLEKCVEERDLRVKEIKKKYKEEIKQVKMIGNSEDIAGVIAGMKNNLKAEVSELEKEIRLKKKMMIEEVRGKNI